MTLYRSVFLLIAVISFYLPSVNAETVNVDLAKSSPVGSWQLREETVTDAKGRQTMTSVRTSMIGVEERDGEPYYWVEMVVDNYKLKKGKRKKTGDQTIVKSLMAANLLSGDPANAINNLRGFAKELIIQSGNGDPMIIREAGGFLGGMMKSMGTEINYDFSDLGNETVEVTAGKFDANKMQGSGTTEVNAVFKKIRVESDATTWISKSVPFGLVKAEGVTITNGKKSTNSTDLVEYGMTGAVSLITKTPQEMPSMKGIFGQ